MKYYDHTYNSGDITTHDTDASIWDSALVPVNSLLLQGAGVVPGAGGVTYQFMEHDGFATLSTNVDTKQGPCPIWFSSFVATATQIRNVWSASNSVAESYQVNRKLETIRAPGLVTVLFPIGLMWSGPERVSYLADFCKTMAGVWLQGKL